MPDKKVSIYEEELNLLRKIAEKSSDLQLGFGWPEFCDGCGGIKALKASHAIAVNNWEKWMNESEIEIT